MPNVRTVWKVRMRPFWSGPGSKGGGTGSGLKYDAELKRARESVPIRTEQRSHEIHVR